MNTINLREEVRKVIQSQWPAFEQDHPNLAAVLDQDLLVQQAMRSIGDDPDFQQVMSQARAAGIGAQAGVDLLRRLVSKWLWALV